MARLMKAEGFRAVCVDSVEALLQQELPATNAILLVDVRTVGQPGASLHEQLNKLGLTPMEKF